MVENGVDLRLAAIRPARPRGGRPRRDRRGTVLIIAMIVVVALAAMAITLGRSMGVEATASANQLAAQDASAIARGAEQYVLAMLAQDVDPIDLQDQSLFEQVPVGDGYFWVVRPDYRDPTLPAFGLVDESSKLDINATSDDLLARLPGMTQALGDAIRQWRTPMGPNNSGDANDDPYQGRDTPYRAKRAPFETVEELLLVDGVTPELLYGMGSAVPLGLSDAGLRRDRSAAYEPVQAHGLFDYLTIWSGSSSAASSTTSSPRINIESGRQRDALRALLIEVLGQQRGAGAARLFPGRREDFGDLFSFASRLKLTADELQKLEPRISVGNANRVLAGKVNVNQAPRDVLLCLNGMNDQRVDALLSRRPSAVAANPISIAWVYDVLGEEARQIGNALIGQGSQYSADMVAVSGNGRAFKRVRIVIDTTGEAPPRIVYRRDWTDRGWPLDPQILASMRSGGGAGADGGASMFASRR